MKKRTPKTQRLVMFGGGRGECGKRRDWRKLQDARTILRLCEFSWGMRWNLSQGRENWNHQYCKHVYGHEPISVTWSRTVRDRLYKLRIPDPSQIVNMPSPFLLRGIHKIDISIAHGPEDAKVLVVPLPKDTVGIVFGLSWLPNKLTFSQLEPSATHRGL